MAAPSRDRRAELVHQLCVRVPDGETGYWLFPDDVGKGLYDESPTGAGFYSS